MNAEIVGRLQQTFVMPSQQFPSASISLMAGVQYQLAAARYQLQQAELEKQKLLDPVQEAIALLKEAGLDKQIHGFRTLEKLSEADRYSDSYLRKRTKEAEEELARADQMMKKHVSAYINDPHPIE